MPGFYLRWVNDEPGRVAEMQAKGYAFVSVEEVDFYDSIDSSNIADGGQIRKNVKTTGREGGTPTAYLMKIPLDWKRQSEDKLAWQIDKIEESINAGAFSAGNEAASVYIPNGEKNSLSHPFKKL